MSILQDMGNKETCRPLVEYDLSHMARGELMGAGLVDEYNLNPITGLGVLG